jgi:hypothetical protein
VSVEIGLILASLQGDISTKTWQRFAEINFFGWVLKSLHGQGCQDGTISCMLNKQASK